MAENLKFSYMEHMPDNTLIEIFAHLSPKSLKLACLVTPRWNDIIRMSPRLMKHYKLNLDPAQRALGAASFLSDKFTFNDLLELTTRKSYQSASVRYLDASPVEEILKAHNLRTFEITDCKVFKKTLTNVLKNMKFLENLVLQEVQVFIDMSDTTDPEPVQLNHLKSLKLWLSDPDILELISTTTLKSVEIKTSSIWIEHFESIDKLLQQQLSLKHLKLVGETVIEDFFKNGSHLKQPYKLKSFDVSKCSTNQLDMELTQFLRIHKNTLEDLKMEMKLPDSFQIFILKEMTGLKTLQMPLCIKCKEHKIFIDQMLPLPRIETFYDLSESASLFSYKNLANIFPNLTAIKTRRDRIKILSQTHPTLQRLHTDFIEPSLSLTKFNHLKELRVATIHSEVGFNNFIDGHSETLERLIIGRVDGDSFSRGLTVDSMKRCKKLLFVSITTDSPIVTKMISKIQRDFTWILESRFKKSSEEEYVRVVFKFPEDQAVFEEKCRTWDDQMIRDLYTVENYGLNSFVNKFK